MPNSTPAERDKRILYSAAWMEGAKRKTASCDVVFVDPDNGLEVISVDRQHKQGPKYVFFDELASYLERDQSLIVYHHLCRTGTAEEQINARFTQIKNRLGASRGILALLYRRGTLRAFFIIPSAKHEKILFERAEQLARQSPWSKHFDLFVCR